MVDGEVRDRVDGVGLVVKERIPGTLETVSGDVPAADDSRDNRPRVRAPSGVMGRTVGTLSDQGSASEASAESPLSDATSPTLQRRLTPGCP